METYQAVALAVMAAMGFVVHSTMQLNGLRKRMRVEKVMFNYRDLSVILRPGEFDPRRCGWCAPTGPPA